MDEYVRGMLYTIVVENNVCQQTEFHFNSGGLDQPPATVLLFRPNEPYSEEKEILSDGQRYLLFLTAPDEAQQREWTGKFVLDARATYFRGEETARGVIQLAQPTPENPNPRQPEVLDKITKLCEAARPTDLAEKLSHLQSLAISGDPILEKEARIALEEIPKLQLQERR